MRILIFGPNGSGKGTQSAVLLKRFELAHVESGGIFRENIKSGTELGKQAKKYIDDGHLVPDSITIPMVLDRFTRPDCANGWVLDGFPRTPEQSKALLAGLEAAGTELDGVVVIEVARETARKRLLGRRACPSGHPNNTAIEAIRPTGEGEQLCCWKCGAALSPPRPDDVNEAAIDQRLDIYFDEEKGTLASIRVVEDWAHQGKAKFLRVNGEGAIESITTAIFSGLGLAT